MRSWIAAWVFVFATGALIAILANRQDWRKNLPEALLMAAIMIGSGLLVLYH